MNILHTIEFYHPSVGSAQEVVRQISERVVTRGHRITVAITRLANRTSLEVNGVTIQEFDVSGNAVSDTRGESERYQRFLIEGDFDIMMNNAAQEWTMDLAIPSLDRLSFHKVMIPCGFSGMYNPAYRDYFVRMPEVMRSYDHLVFHASDYRDIHFARQTVIDYYSVIPNGASRADFSPADMTFPQRYGIPEDALNWQLLDMMRGCSTSRGRSWHRRTRSSIFALYKEGAREGIVLSDQRKMDRALLQVAMC